MVLVECSLIYHTHWFYQLGRCYDDNCRHRHKVTARWSDVRYYHWRKVWLTAFVVIEQLFLLIWLRDSTHTACAYRRQKLGICSVRDVTFCCCQYYWVSRSVHWIFGMWNSRLVSVVCSFVKGILSCLLTTQIDLCQSPYSSCVLWRRCVLVFRKILPSVPIPQYQLYRQEPGCSLRVVWLFKCYNHSVPTRSWHRITLAQQQQRRVTALICLYYHQRRACCSNRFHPSLIRKLTLCEKARKLVGEYLCRRRFCTVHELLVYTNSKSKSGRPKDRHTIASRLNGHCTVNREPSAGLSSRIG